MLIQLTGLSGAGKTSIAYRVKQLFLKNTTLIRVEVLDADECRKTLCKDLGFSRQDRIENIMRLGKIAGESTSKGIITIVAAINPYEVARVELRNRYNAKLVWIKCAVETLIMRDTKGLYRRAFLKDEDDEKIHNLTGINDPFEIPVDPDLIVDTGIEDLEASSEVLQKFILRHLKLQS